MKLTEKLNLVPRRRSWQLAALGNTEGSVNAKGKTIPLKRGSAATAPGRPTGSLRFECAKGSFGDSLDDFLFCYTEISPEKENFDLSALFTVKEASETLSWQSGYGIFAVDTVACGNGNQRYRNHLGIGRFRTRSATLQSAGMRAVAGYREEGAGEVCGRRTLDLSRDAAFPEQKTRITAGEQYRFRLKKTDDGFTGEIAFQGQTQTFTLPGCDFLMQQDKKSLYVGFAVAGAMTLEVRDIRFQLRPGKSSVTPEGAIRMALPDYPFPRELFNGVKPSAGTLPGRELYVSPEGRADGDGSKENPLELQTALLSARPGQTIRLLDGVYAPEKPYYVPKEACGKPEEKIMLRAERFGGAVLDGGKLAQTAPLLTLRGDKWHIKDLIFQESPLSGLLICGSGNLIEHCEARHNRDTGILICTYPGTGRAEWPHDNHVLCCDSHHNRDSAGENADGFGVKLSVGEGNVCFECSAHHNVDDGFDLFSKNVLGPIGAVTLENCVAYENGRRKKDRREEKTGGTGFKLGGDHLVIPHRAKNCIAWGNLEAGFSTNNNPVTRMENLTAWQNGKTPLLYNYRLFTGRRDIRPDWQVSGLLPEDSVFASIPGEKSLPRIMQENPGETAEELSLQQQQALENLFITTDPATPVTRDENDLLNLHGLFTLKDASLPGARLDAEHMEERLERKAQLIKEQRTPCA